MSRQITGNQYNEFLAIGRLISEKSFKKNKKEIEIDGGKIDIIKKERNRITLIEVKKSSKYMEAAKMQLIFYLSEFEKKGFSVKGELRVPKEKRMIQIELNEKSKEELENVKQKIKALCDLKHPPHTKFGKKCKSCSYNEFCWS